MAQAAQQRILLAGTVDAVRTARLIIGEGFDYRCATSLDEARTQLCPDLAAVVCSLRLDDAPVVELLEQLGPDVPVVCFHAHGRELSGSARESVREALQALGNARFVDLYAIARSRGVPAAAAALREAVSSAFAG
ncbi:MAG TPA: hypothetical protein VF211_01025 [Burkholderiales bacterium]